MRAANARKAATPALTLEGLQRRITAPHSPVLALARFDRADERIAGDATIVVLNPDASRDHGIDIGPMIKAAGGRFGSFEDATPGDRKGGGRDRRCKVV